MAVRNRQRFKGIVESDGTLRSLTCCFTPRRGDTLVRRSDYRFLYLGVDIGAIYSGTFDLPSPVAVRAPFGRVFTALHL